MAKKFDEDLIANYNTWKDKCIIPSTYYEIQCDIKVTKSKNVMIVYCAFYYLVVLPAY